VSWKTSDSVLVILQRSNLTSQVSRLHSHNVLIIYTSYGKYTDAICIWCNSFYINLCCG